jgi:hypothetical protein
VPRIGFLGNPEALPQVFDGRPSIPKPCRAAKYGSICHTNRRAVDNSLVLDSKSYVATVAFFRVTGFLVNHRGVFWKSEFSLSNRKDVKETIPVRPRFPQVVAAKAERMNDEAHARTDKPGDQRKILDAPGGDT